MEPHINAVVLCPLTSLLKSSFHEITLDFYTILLSCPLLILWLALIFASPKPSYWDNVLNSLICPEKPFTSPSKVTWTHLS